MFTPKTKRLLRQAISGFDLNTTEMEYVHLRGADGMFGYYKKGSDKDSDDDGRWPEDGLQLIKPCKLLKKLATDASIDHTDKDIEDMVNKIKNIIAVYGDEHGDHSQPPILSIVKGHLIGAYYLEHNYIEQAGNLGGSCMRYESCLPAFKIYEENQDVVSMLVLKSNDNKVMARALLWNYAGEYYMDTIYSTKDNFRDMLIDYAVRHNFYYKSQQSCHHNVFDRKGGSGVLPFVLSIPVNFNHEWQVPYMDTMFFVVERANKYYVTNCLANDDTGSIYRMRSTTASNQSSWTPADDYLLHMEVAFSLLYNSKVSDKADQWINDKGDKDIDDDDLACVIKEDYRYHNSYKKFFLGEEVYEEEERDEDEVYCDYIDEYRHIDDCIYIERGQRRDEYVLSEDAVEVRRQWWWREDNDLVCAADGEMYHCDDAIYCEYTNEYYYHTECIHVEGYGYVNESDVDEVGVEITDGNWYYKDNCMQCEISGDWMLTCDAKELPDGRYVTEEEYDKWMEDNVEEERP